MILLLHRSASDSRHEIQYNNYIFYKSKILQVIQFLQLKVTLINAFSIPFFFLLSESLYAQTNNMTYLVLERLKMMWIKQKLGLYIWRIF
jgi:hypothetical protein